MWFMVHLTRNERYAVINYKHRLLEIYDLELPLDVAKKNAMILIRKYKLGFSTVRPSTFDPTKSEIIVTYNDTVYPEVTAWLRRVHQRWITSPWRIELRKQLAEERAAFIKETVNLQSDGK